MEIIINADDYGWNKFNDEIIQNLYLNNSISSASFMVNGSNASNSATFAIQNQMPLGLHLNLTEGRPISNSITLINQHGQMLGKYGFREKINLIDVEDIKKEIRAQINQFIKYIGRLPTHCDGHQHIHVLEKVSLPLAQIMSQEFGINKIRLIREIDQNIEQPFYQQVIKQSLQAENIFLKYNIYSSDKFIGLNLMGFKLNLKKLVNYFQNLNGTVEWMCHPGQQNEEGEDFYGSQERNHEASTLEKIKNSWEKLISFKDMRLQKINRHTILFYSQMVPGTGNFTTTLRIQQFLQDRGYRVLIRSVCGFSINNYKSMESETEDVRNLCRDVDLVFGVNIYRTGKILSQIKGLKYGLIIAGTDANLYLNSHKKEILKAVNQSQILISLNQEMKDIMKRETEKEIIVIHQSVSDIQVKEEFQITKLLNIDQNSKIILLPASIRKVKDVSFILDPIEYLFKNFFNNHYLLILGPILEYEYYIGINQQIDEINNKLNKKRIILTEPINQDQFRQLLINNTELLINCSIAEGLSSSILEAQKYGIPVLVRNNEGNLSIIENKKNGLVFSNQEEFKQCYQLLMKDQNLKQTLIENGKKKYEQKQD